jgi:hypothetical protein
MFRFKLWIQPASFTLIGLGVFGYMAFKEIQYHRANAPGAALTSR